MTARRESSDVSAGSGPTNETPLSRYFYDAWLESGATMESIARKARVSLPTLWAYLHGTRGGGGMSRTRPTLTKIARALDLDVEKALTLAGVSIDPGVEQAIRADPSLSRRNRELLVTMYRQMRRD